MQRLRCMRRPVRIPHHLARQGDEVAAPFGQIALGLGGFGWTWMALAVFSRFEAAVKATRQALIGDA
jgi:hypothetical protein